MTVLHDTFPGTKAIEQPSASKDENVNAFAAWCLAKSQQNDVFRIYHDTIQVTPASFDANLSNREQLERFNTDGVVKHAPHLDDQLIGGGRDNLIECVVSTEVQILSSHSSSVHDRKIVSERDALRSLDDFLDLASNVDDRAQFLRENLSFIGKKELDEATMCIATVWKAAITSRPDLKILPITEIASSNAWPWERPIVKSDKYILERILENFSYEELESYKNNIILDESRIKKADRVKIVLLDDWTLSGKQLSRECERVVERFPDKGGSIEIQLIAADCERIKQGLRIFNSHEQEVPVRAYWMSCDADGDLGGNITGAHSSSDYGFSTHIERMAMKLERSGRGRIDIPELANLVPPYRLGRGRDFQMPRYNYLKNLQMH